MLEALAQMIEALGLEIAAIRKKGSGSQVELRGGELVGQSNGAWLYRFLVTDDIYFRDDTPVRITAGQEDVDGVLVSFRDGVVVIALEKNLGPKIAVARLVANDTFLIERLRERLEKVRSGEAQFNRSAAERVLGLTKSEAADAEPDESVKQGDALNSEQLDAIRHSLGSDTTYVWGPPGTGKTMTLARIVEAHYRAGRSVLLVSNTNIAVDTALKKVADRLKGETEFHLGLVIRQGPVVKSEELEQLYGDQVILDRIVARLGEKLEAEKDLLTLEAAPLAEKEREYAATLKKIELLTEQQGTLATYEKELETTKSKVVSRQREAEDFRITASRISVDLERARAMSAVRRFFAGLKPENLIRQAAEAERAGNAATDAALALAGDLPKLQADIERLKGDVDRLAAETKNYLPASELQARVTALQTRLHQSHERIAAIDRELAEIEQQVIAHCRILATTVYRTYISKNTMRQFDVVVVDEASMLMPPLVYYSAGLAVKSVTVAGDFRQLPPIVTSDEPLAEQWLKRDVFEVAGIAKHVEQRETTSTLIQLKTQYRMREQICTVINTLFYDGSLRSDWTVNAESAPFPLGSAALLYVDSAPFHPWTALRVGSYSRYNLFHALLVRNIVLYLAKTGFIGDDKIAVGAVAPYSSQARLIQALLEDRLGSRAVGIAATVHRFQGNEKRVMLVDLTDSLGAPLGRFLRATGREEDGARLLNVAVSRAKHHVVLLGNFEYLRAKAPRSSFVRRIVDQFEEHGEAIKIDDLLPLAEPDWVDGLHRVMPATFDFPEGGAGAFTEGTFYPAFLKDLIRAQQSIVILSPFATGRGAARWVDPLRAAFIRGVRIRVLTRPPEEPGGGGTEEVAELVQGLRDLGVTVDLRARMHEKIAILDGHVLWHGSLNILSHRDTHESMLRIESPAACRQVGRFVSTPKAARDEEATLDSSENPQCPRCGRPTVWNNGKFGIWFECEDKTCNVKIDPRRRSNQGRNGDAPRGAASQTKSSTRSKDAHPDRSCPKPGCTGKLAVRMGRRGKFLGCTKYPACKYTEDLA